MGKSSLIIITLCVAATLAFSAITQKIIKHYDLGGIGSDNQQQPEDFQPKGEDISQ